MPPTDRQYVVDLHDGKHHAIRCGGPCRDNYTRIVIHDDEGQIVKLQRAAWLTFHDAEIALGSQIGITGSWRSCAYQRQLYAADHNRYAPPDKTAHVRGLAIDVSQAQPPAKLAKVRGLLIARRWYQARIDEPWHYSYGIEV
jgi:LAS superfamily LD-carboxypeptidase LdcB